MITSSITKQTASSKRLKMPPLLLIQVKKRPLLLKTQVLKRAVIFKVSRRQPQSVNFICQYLESYLSERLPRAFGKLLASTSLLFSTERQRK